jgi:multiple sugar transport system permease protein/sn-glycerol 3-phosphate transport system permease protein
VCVVVVGIITSFHVFDLVHLMTHGGPGNRTNVLVYYIYQHAFRFADYGMGSALTVVFVVMILAVILVLMRLLERRTHYEV